MGGFSESRMQLHRLMETKSYYGGGWFGPVLAENHGYSNCIVSGQQSVAISCAEHDDESKRKLSCNYVGVRC